MRLSGTFTRPLLSGDPSAKGTDRLWRILPLALLLVVSITLCIGWIRFPFTSRGFFWRETGRWLPSGTEMIGDGHWTAGFDGGRLLALRVKNDEVRDAFIEAWALAEVSPGEDPPMSFVEPGEFDWWPSDLQTAPEQHARVDRSAASYASLWVRDGRVYVEVGNW